MSKLITVQGCTIEYDLPDDVNGSVSLVATVALASSKISSGGNKAYKDKITITVTSGQVDVTEPPAGCTNPGVVPPGTITINGSSEKAHIQGKALILEEDEGDNIFSCLFPLSSGSGTSAGNVKIRAKVTATNQNVVKVT